jgi:hypothetical protein
MFALGLGAPGNPGRWRREATSVGGVDRRPGTRRARPMERRRCSWRGPDIFQFTKARTLLGSPARSTYFQWKKAGYGQFGRDALERVSPILGT